ncbi:MAG: DNA gyrase subunit A [Eubacteriales bacterium]|nr:DNA gyrase subunit A [Eubacteriales bacterium]
MDNENYTFEDQKIVEIDMVKEVKTSFIQYAMSVIMARALPDVRDGLKPVHRRILYAMHEDGLTYDKPFHKSAATVGNVLGRYHPHGDTAVYDTMVRMAQPFSLRYPLVEGHGNFGNVDGDQPAAYRYTEARMSRLADEMPADIQKNTVEYTSNFDNRRLEPTVLPARFPNLLVNGSIGIAVGMATNIPPHNLGEVIDGAIYLMDNPDATVTDLMEYIKGPDFPTYASICGTSGIMSAYATGRGKIIVHAKAEVDEEKRRIIVTEIPYQVNKSNLVESMASCVKDKKIEGITEIRDETGRDGMRIVIEYRRDANGQIILNQLYKFTQLQDTFAANMLALVDNVPKVLTLKEMLSHYITHQEDVVSRRVRFDLDKAQRDAHIYEGYKTAIDHIDEVIQIIRSSASIPEARENLMRSFNLSEEQAQAIVEMTLGRLSGLERQKIEDRLENLYLQIAEYEAILSDENKLKDIIKSEMLEIKRRFSDPRRTELLPVEDEIIIEDLIERHTCVITMTRAGYIKRQPSDVYTAQGRGGKGIIGMGTKDEDFVEHCIAADSHAYLAMFTNRGRIYFKKAYMIPESGRTSRGTNIVNILELDEGEMITAMITLKSFPENEYLLMVTKKGIAKRSSLKEYEIKRRGGKIALTLDEDDELMFVRRTRGNDQIMIATGKGYAVRFDESKIRCMGRTARGVRGIRLRENDWVAGACIVDENKKLLIITERGYGKRSSFDEFRLFENRGGSGVRCHNTAKRGKIAGIATVSDDDDVIIITDDGSIIRTSVDRISVQGRTASGVIVMKPAEGASVVGFALVANENADSEAIKEIEKEIEDDPLPPQTDDGGYDDAETDETDEYDETETDEYDETETDEYDDAESDEGEPDGDI